MTHLRALALTLLRAVDEGHPATPPARDFALAVLRCCAPDGEPWRVAVAVMEGGPLRVRHAVTLAALVLGDADPE